MRKRHQNHMERGQAMVEFALTSLLFILLVVSIIEIARIMHAYVTLQHAARVGGRYAVTGQWMPEFAASLDGHYDPNSGDPYARIYPCYPRFPDYDEKLKTHTPNGPQYYEPFRGPRTCSIEKQVLQQMRPLALLPDASANQPGYYEVVISSPAVDSTPTTGKFNREVPGPTYYFSDFYSNDDPTSTFVRGYAGRPNGKVIVQVRYNVRMITPLLANIVPYIPLQAHVVMTNEAFGSTSVLTEAAPAPNLDPVDPLHQPEPPDLVFEAENTKDLSGVTNPSSHEAVTYQVSVTNQGEVNATQNFDVCLYAARDNNLNSSHLRNPAVVSPTNPGDSAVRKLGCTVYPKLEAGNTDDLDTQRQITVSNWQDVGVGVWHIYAVIDPAQDADTTDGVEGTIDEKGIDPARPAHEDNNWMYLEQIEIGRGVKLSLTASLPDGVDHIKVGETFKLMVTVTNDGPHAIEDLKVKVPMPLEFFECETCKVDPALNYTQDGDWFGVDIPAGTSTSIVLDVKVINWRPEWVYIQPNIYPEHMPANYYLSEGELPLIGNVRVKLHTAGE